MRKNKGFTLIELIVVIVIIAVLATVAGLSISTVNATSAKKAAAQIDSYLSVVRTKCMARAGSPEVVLYEKDGVICGDYYENGAVVRSEVVSDRRVTVSIYYDNGEQNPVSITDGKAFEFSFKRSTGALEPRKLGTDATDALKNAKKVYITVTGGTKTYTVTLLSATGNHEVTE